MFHQKPDFVVTALIMSLSFFGLQACGGGGTTESRTQNPITQQPGDTTAPSIMSSSLDATPVDYTKVITVMFDEKIKAINSDVVLHFVPGQNAALVTIPTTVSTNGAQLIITPDSSVATPLLASSNYHLILNTSITDETGNNIAEQQYSFSTSATPITQQPDTIAPKILSSSVATSPVDFTQAITVTFDEDVTATAADVVLHRVPGQNAALVVVPTTVSVNGAIVTITTNSSAATPLLAATNYHLILKSTITDIKGNAFVEQALSFTTSAVNNGGGNGGGGSGNTTKTITFIELNDLHANLVPHTEMIRQGPGQKVLISERGGLVQIAAKIDEIRKTNLKRTAVNSTILMNIGDTFHGGAEAMFSVGNAIVEPVNALGIDIAVPGNWDFAYGPQVTNFRYGVLVDPGDSVTKQKQVERPNFISLAANAIYKTPTFDVTQTADYLNLDPNIRRDSIVRSGMERVFGNLIANINNDALGQPITITPNNPVPFLPATNIQVVNDVKVGFIGLTSDIVKLMHPLMALNIEFTQGKANYVALVSRLATTLRTTDKVDLVVVMSELGIQKDLAIAELLPANAVNIIFSAHTHELTKTMETTKSGTIVVEAGNDTFLGQMDVTFDSANVPSYNWTIHPIDKSIVPDMTVAYIKNVQDLVTQAQDRFLKINNADVNTYIPIPQVTLNGVSGNNNLVLPQELKWPLTSMPVS